MVGKSTIITAKSKYIVRNFNVIDIRTVISNYNSAKLNLCLIFALFLVLFTKDFIILALLTDPYLNLGFTV